ncbi:MAG: ATP synthase F0 subunit C [Deltaproteobacteria bacterium]|nr:ATP synthase F0 subunit C [Deltaproteobacteria bacterium]
MLKKIAVVLAVLASPALGLAAETAALPSGEGVFTFFKAALALGCGLAIGIAALGGALGQGRAAAAALEGIARNPEAAGKVMTPMIIALALIESLVIYALVISFMLMGKI